MPATNFLWKTIILKFFLLWNSAKLTKINSCMSGIQASFRSFVKAPKYFKKGKIRLFFVLQSRTSNLILIMASLKLRDGKSEGCFDQ